MRFPPVTPIIALALIGTAASAELSECVAIDDDLDRLACFDRVSGKTPTTEVVETGSDWEVQTKTSEFEDTTDVYLRVTSEEDISCGRLSDRPASLWIRCLENTTSIILSTECHLTSSRYNDYGDVDMRLDDNPSMTISMEQSTSNDSLGLWSGGQSIPVIKKMFGKDQLITRFTPFSQSPVTARFNISGLEDAIGPLRKSCGW